MRTGVYRSLVIGAMVAIFSAAEVSVLAEPNDFLPSRANHRLLRDDLPPGYVGSARLSGHGPVAGYFQPVAFSGPDKVEFALAERAAFSESSQNLMAGLLIGSVYRFRITGIPDADGAELYPTVELIDRTYPPPGLATSFPIPINLDREDLDAALAGRLVTRVIYLEDTSTALPIPETPRTSRALEIAEYQDALEVADRFGRPVAIVRIGSVAPPTTHQLMPQFFFGYPTWAPIFQSQHPSTQPSL